MGVDPSTEPSARTMISSLESLDGRDQIVLNRNAMALHPFCRLSGPANVLAANMAGNGGTRQLPPERTHGMSRWKLQDLECLQSFSILATKEHYREALRRIL